MRRIRIQEQKKTDEGKDSEDDYIQRDKNGMRLVLNSNDRGSLNKQRKQRKKERYMYT